MALRDKLHRRGIAYDELSRGTQEREAAHPSSGKPGKQYPEAWADTITRFEGKPGGKQVVEGSDCAECVKIGIKGTVGDVLVQTRSSDEPMTQKSTCTNCGRTWMRS